MHRRPNTKSPPTRNTLEERTVPNANDSHERWRRMWQCVDFKRAWCVPERCQIQNSTGPALAPLPGPPANHQQTINPLPPSFSPPSPPDDRRSTRRATSTFRGHLTSGLRQSLPARPLQPISRLQCPPPLVGRHWPCPLPACQQQGHDTMTGSEQEPTQLA